MVTATMQPGTEPHDQAGGGKSEKNLLNGVTVDSPEFGLVKGQIDDCFRMLSERLVRLSAAIRSDGSAPAEVRALPAGLKADSSHKAEILYGEDARAQIIAFYRGIFFGDGVASNSTSHAQGYAIVSGATIEIAKEVNTLKHTFAELCGQLSRRNIRFKDGEGEVKGNSSGGFVTALRIAFKELGLARLSFRQAVRRIPLLDECPSSVSFSSSELILSIRRVAVECVMERITRTEYPSAKTTKALEILSGLPDREELAEVIRNPRDLRCNIVAAKRRQLNTSMPLLIPLPTRGSEFPKVRWPLHSARARRAVVKLESSALLPLYNIYRYTPKHRKQVPR